LQDFFAQCLARDQDSTVLMVTTYQLKCGTALVGLAKRSILGLFVQQYDTGKPVFFQALEDIQTSTWKQFVLTARHKIDRATIFLWWP
jgi:hypothetical protein